ncbi:hypothetical protein L2E82_27072 [Cichorium intybus]|uniref:Uncharacterized protein n=1 Tax=Cichorium intybus TaxID=13427 RepID=A0ACB9CRY6_CICIN|nr:hypothetical protein L2E82_27072 [Cichorium intybus]
MMAHKKLSVTPSPFFSHCKILVKILCIYTNTNQIASTRLQKHGTVPSSLSGLFNRIKLNSARKKHTVV